ncbi:hypothetical protein BCR43DRAFT_499109 [Syncephalastrum racemosum]|uniref:Uncharacterized protein n=1 Tax=Syncephalastrum racemosum TaxID=13706 RepID=A0A1X2H1Z1_SYNRA|nr:hypothetical protein BCR43DRAFT_499109 [Syncephalastrum racemosum]
MDHTILQMKQTVDETHSVLRQVHEKFSSLETTNQLLLKSLQSSINDKQEQQPPEETTSFDQRLSKANDILQQLIQQAQRSLDQNDSSTVDDNYANIHDAQQAKRFLVMQNIQRLSEQKLSHAVQELLDTVSPTSFGASSSFLQHQRQQQPRHIHHHHHHHYHLHKHRHQRSTSLGQLFSHALRSLHYSSNPQNPSPHDIIKDDTPPRPLSRPTLHRLMFYASLLLFDLFSFMRQRNFFSLLHARTGTHPSRIDRRRRKRLSRFAASSDSLPFSTWFQRTTLIFYVAHIASRHSAFSFCL